ncbi:NUDIX hydrolase [Rhodotorula taiwanensis]|uniref:Large ribosomal subunit protein mL46 n=1 Tax=Rhodotorula taiwanensis TaxID=741276 RepID=A0A2S5B7S7_9BASI|nr:NUDIX hydrolase [Rhodotorula taiwanensis]
MFLTSSTTMAASRTPAVGRTLLSAPCSCSAPARLPRVRLQSTAAVESSGEASSSAGKANEAPSPRHRVVAAALLSRPPLLLPQLSPLERTYYAYQRRIHRALAKPFDVSSQWFFKKASQAEKAFTAFDQRAVEAEKHDDATGRKAFEMASEEVEGAPEFLERETEADKQGDVRSLERKQDRTLYLLLQKKRADHAWQFPQGGVEGTESLVDAAQRELLEETGPNVDVWPVGRVPAGAFSYPFPPAHKKKFPDFDSARVFFMPMRMIRGQAVPNQKEGIVDFAWLTKEEVKDKVSAEYWQAVEPILSDQ